MRIRKKMGFSLKFVCKIASNEQNVRLFCSLLAICAVFCLSDDDRN